MFILGIIIMFVLITLVVYFVVHISKPKPNLTAQRALFCQNYKKIFNDLEKFNKATPFDMNDVMDAIDYLFELYALPDIRTCAERKRDKECYMQAFPYDYEDIDKGEDFKKYSLPFKIYGCIDTDRIGSADKCLSDDYALYWNYHYPPHLKDISLVMGQPNSERLAGNFKYKYDYYGLPEEFGYGYHKIIEKDQPNSPEDLINIICDLLTQRETYNRRIKFDKFWGDKTLKVEDPPFTLWQEDDGTNRIHYPWWVK